MQRWNDLDGTGRLFYGKEGRDEAGDKQGTFSGLLVMVSDRCVCYLGNGVINACEVLPYSGTSIPAKVGRSVGSKFPQNSAHAVGPEPFPVA